ncbi:MAG: IS630 family transposase [Geminicoccaceae bacterium]
MAIQEATPIMLSAEERSALEAWARAPTSEQRLAERARIILLAAGGLASRAIARELDCSRGVVSKWRTRFAAARLVGLADRPRSGKPKTYDASADRRILAVLDGPPPEGFARWTAPLIARALGDVSDQHVWRFLRAQRIDLAGRTSWCVSTDPEFAAKAADIVGLYLNPPDNALVLAVDEKPAIQALERAQGYLKLPNGRALTGFAHEYKRRGTTTLFAALDVATGQITAKHSKRRRRVEFLDFMNAVIADHRDQEIHVILDNLRTHKPKRDQWLNRHKNVHFHFTPTHASWLNQVEIWFSILSRSTLKGASFTAVRQLRAAIDAFVQAYNTSASPFQWRKARVRPNGLATRITDLC